LVKQLADYVIRHRYSHLEGAIAPRDLAKYRYIDATYWPSPLKSPGGSLWL
jgi:hypothetical protein